jgi:hypothetical protein
MGENQKSGIGDVRGWGKTESRGWGRGWGWGSRGNGEFPVPVTALVIIDLKDPLPGVFCFGIAAYKSTVLCFVLPDQYRKNQYVYFVSGNVSSYPVFSS